MPAKTYFIRFLESFSQKDRGQVVRLLKENDIMCDVAASRKAISSSFPIPPVPQAPEIDLIRVVDQYGAFKSLIDADKLPDGCCVSSQ